MLGDSFKPFPDEDEPLVEFDLINFLASATIFILVMGALLGLVSIIV